MDEHVPPQAKSSERLSCGWSFETLDPEHPDPRKRRFVRCTNPNCRRSYLAIHVKPGFRCTRLSCDSSTFEPFDGVKSPKLPHIRVRRPIPFNSGPLNTFGDQPIGITAGTVYADNEREHIVFFRNNSSETLTLPQQLGPIWLSIAWHHQSNAGDSASADTPEFAPHPVETPLTLPPGECAQAIMRGHAFRPIRGECYADIGKQGLKFLSAQEPLLFHTACAVAAGLAFVHWWAIRWGGSHFTLSWRAGFTLSLLIGWIVFVSPEILWRGLLQLLGEGISLPLLDEVHQSVSGIGARRIAAPFLRLPLVLVSVGVVTVISSLVWYFLFMAVLPTWASWVCSLVYAVALVAGLSWWLTLYEFTPMTIFRQLRAAFSSMASQNKSAAANTAANTSP